jgi:choline kinase
MKAIILAAGRGSRLHPYTKNTPKCLTELAGETLIGRQIKTLRECGIDEIVIVTGFMAHKLVLPDTKQVFNPFWATTNMVESLFCAKEFFDDDIFVSYSDIIYESRNLKALIESPHAVSVLVDRQWQVYWEHRFKDPLSDAESLIMDDEGCILDIGQKVVNIDSIEAQYMGLMRFQKGGVHALKKAWNSLLTIRREWMERRLAKQAYMTDLLMEMIFLRIQVHAVIVDGGWLEIDTVSDFEGATSMIVDGSISRFYHFDS